MNRLILLINAYRNSSVDAEEFCLYVEELWRDGFISDDMLEYVEARVI